MDSQTYAKVTPTLRTRDPRFASNAARSGNCQQLAPILGERLEQLRAAALIALLTDGLI